LTDKLRAIADGAVFFKEAVMKRAALISVLGAFFLGQAHAATMRCDGGLIATGAGSFEVLTKCGEPYDKEIVEPATRPDGNPARGSVTVETWIYGPDNGAHRFLRL